MNRIVKTSIIILLFKTATAIGQQKLTLQQALNLGVANYGSVKSKSFNAKASEVSIASAKRDYLPNVVIAAQQDYGTINGQNGPLYGYGGYGVASSGLPLPNQNWNAAFGALYLANINWEFFTFGRIRDRIKTSAAAWQRDKDDLNQEQFQHQVRVASAYMNLLASQRLALAQQKNLQRAMVFRKNVALRAYNGLVAGVDSSLANAEVSNAKIALIRAKDFQQEQANRLAVLMGIAVTDFVLDTSFVNRIPSISYDSLENSKPHPVLEFYKSRVEVSKAQSRWISKSYYPSLSMFGIFQERASGFNAGYTQDQTSFNQNYGKGVTPTRGNYLAGVGLTWNLTTLWRTNAQAKSQQFITQSLQSDYDLVTQQLQAQSSLADSKLKNALDSYNEAPVQIKSATDAYNQKNALYKNGLTTLVDVTQTLYALNRAEVDRDIAYVNVWQALLLKAAAAGDIEILVKEL